MNASVEEPFSNLPLNSTSNSDPIANTAAAPLSETDLWALIDALMQDPRPARQVAQDDDGVALRDALPNLRVRDYLATGCATVAGARRVLALASAFAHAATTTEQAVTANSLAAWAALSLGRPAAGRRYLAKALSADPDHGLSLLIRKSLFHHCTPSVYRGIVSLARSRLCS